jgi:flagellar protein FlbT
MTGLVLKLRPFEKLLVNGVILQNGERATRLRVRTAGASILRLRDAIHPEQAKTPLERVYYVAQLAVAGAADAAAARIEILAALDAEMNEERTEEVRGHLVKAREAADAGRLFSVMRSLRRVLPPAATAPES